MSYKIEDSKVQVKLLHFLVGLSLGLDFFRLLRHWHSLALVITFLRCYIFMTSSTFGRH